MKEIPLPQSALARRKKSISNKRLCRACSAFFYIFTGFAVLCLIGVLVTVIAFELRGEANSTLFFALLGGFAGGTLVGALSAFGLAKLLAALDKSRLDFDERCDSAYSFFVGDGTLATFEEKELRIHGEVKSETVVHVPYADVKLYSVCTRIAPKEAGEWSVVLEIPAKYLAKKGKAEKNAPPVLIQTDAKERLYRVIEERGLTLLGEKQGQTENKKFTARAKYFLPLPDKRRRALLIGIIGGVAAIAGIPVALLWDVTIGSILTVVGLFAAGRSVMSFVRAKGVLAVYDEGVYWKDGNGSDRIFLKWEEIESVSRTQIEGERALKLQCAYGAFHLPEIADSYDYIVSLHPEKV